MCSRKESPQGPFLKKIRKTNDIQRQQLVTLSSLPGIGEKTATKLLEKFGSPLKVLNASTTELSKIGGLGQSRANKIKKMLSSKSNFHKKTNQKTLHES